jgi:hypothetical protein
MNRKMLMTGLVVVATVLVVVWALLTRPTVPGPSTGPQPVKAATNPLDVPLLAHMREDGLDVGAEPGHQLVIGRSGNEVSLTLSSGLIEYLGPGSLEQLELSTTQTVVSWPRYERFLEDLHALIVARHPEAHEHEEEEGPETKKAD